MSVSSSLNGPWMVVATGRPGIVLGVERAHHGVVVDHVAVTDRLVGVDDVADLGHGACRSGCLRPPAAPTGGVPGRSSRRWRRGARRGRRPADPGPADRPPARSRRRAEGGWESKVGRSFRSAWRDSSIPAGRVGSPDATAAWPSGLGRGLQSPVRRFDSARRLHPEHRGIGAAPAQRVGRPDRGPTRSGGGRTGDRAGPAGVGVPNLWSARRAGQHEVRADERVRRRSRLRRARRSPTPDGCPLNPGGGGWPGSACRCDRSGPGRRRSRPTAATAG